MKLKIEIEFGNEAMSNLHDAGRSLDWLARNLKNLHEKLFLVFHDLFENAHQTTS